MGDLNSTEFFVWFSSLKALQMNPCPFPNFWSSAPQVVMDKITQLDMYTPH
jgi:hypothetical protein